MPAAPAVGNLRVGRWAAFGDGIHADTVAIQNALADTPGGTVQIPAGTFLISSTLALSTDKTRLLGVGSKTAIRIAGAMSNGLIQVTANQCTIESLLIDGANSTASLNPAADAIVIAGNAVNTRILNISQFYVNGWSANFLSTTTGYGVMIANCHFRQCLNGI